jgi:hypothetical protein
MQQRSKAGVPEAYMQGGTDFWIDYGRGWWEMQSAGNCGIKDLW